jgi:hypothetical protein
MNAVSNIFFNSKIVKSTGENFAPSNRRAGLSGKPAMDEATNADTQPRRTPTSRLFH